MAANTFGLLATGRLLPFATGVVTVRGLHWTGLIVVGGLYIVSLFEAAVAIRERNRALDGVDGP